MRKSAAWENQITVMETNVEKYFTYENVIRTASLAFVNQESAAHMQK